MNTIQARWEAYERNVLPKDAHQIQRQETKRAFYAGAQGVLIITTQMSADNVSDDAAVLMLEGLHQEARAFCADVEAGRA